MRLLDCNDASLRLWQDGEETWSPGIAWFANGRYTFGSLLGNRHAAHPATSTIDFGIAFQPSR